MIIIEHLISGFIGAIISLIVTILCTRKTETFLSKIFSNRIGNKSSRNISGLWVTQYKYPSIDSSGIYFEKIETQIVFFKQTGNTVTGKTQDAKAHPEVLEGRISVDRYFTGMYVNTNNSQNYHGAFQFILSNGKGRMKGRWIGFDNTSTEINSGEWRWQQIHSVNKLSLEDVYTTKEYCKSVDLFDDSRFIM